MTMDREATVVRKKGANLQRVGILVSRNKDQEYKNNENPRDHMMGSMNLIRGGLCVEIN